MVYSKPGYCQCGCEIWIEYLWTGKAWIPRFLDQNNEEILQCPSCGKDLDEDDMESI